MKIHLISMPAAMPWFTPIQMGCLKAYVDKEFKGNKEVHTRTYSAHYSIPMKAFHIGFEKVYQTYESWFELMWFVNVLKRFNPTKSSDINKQTTAIIKKIESYLGVTGTKKVIKKLDEALIDFIEADLVPSLSKKEINLIGFTLTNEQFYSSLYCYLYLKEKHKDTKAIFVFGGDLTTSQRILQTLQSFGVNGLAVVGEGELKIKKIIETVLASSSNDEVKLLNKTHKCIDGVYNIKELTDDDIANMRPSSESQLGKLDNLPIPDYTEYFDTIKKHSSDRTVYATLKSKTIVQLEGSRGCWYGKCDFCGMTSCWKEHRQKTPPAIYRSVTTILKKHGLKNNNISFTDLACDLWAEDFFDLVIKNKRKLDTTLELRSRHDELFYKKLARSGCKSANVGIESFSQQLLEKMNKGVDLIDNLQSLKYLKELGVGCETFLIMKHPKSSTVDVKENKKIAKLISHINKLHPIPYGLARRSGIYNELAKKETLHLKDNNFIKLPENIFNLYINASMSPSLPARKRLPLPLVKKWDSFSKWYKKLNVKGSSLTITRINRSCIRITDKRLGTNKTYVLKDEQEKIYSLCHMALNVEEISTKTGIEKERVKTILEKLIQSKLMVYANNKFLSLGLRIIC